MTKPPLFKNLFIDVLPFNWCGDTWGRGEGERGGQHCVFYLDILILLYVPSLHPQLTGRSIKFYVLHRQCEYSSHSVSCTRTCDRLILHLPAWVCMRDWNMAVVNLCTRIGWFLW